jgi:hypothetical protein
MSKAICVAGILTVCFGGGAVMLITHLGNDGNNVKIEHKLSPRVNMLISQSANKRGVEDTHVLDDNPLVADDIPAALVYLKQHQDYTSYALLLCIRKYYQISYKTLSAAEKATILCSALQNMDFLNDWGLLEPPDSCDNDPAKALLETGKAAVALLAPILDDNEPARNYGFESATLSRRYRRKDYAYRYLSIILGDSVVFHVFPHRVEERDKDIAALKAKLKKQAK